MSRWWCRLERPQPYFDYASDPLSYNLVDPPKVNTIIVPALGWVTIRFVADNPVLSSIWWIQCFVLVDFLMGLYNHWCCSGGPWHSSDKASSLMSRDFRGATAAVRMGALLKIREFYGHVDVSQTTANRSSNFHKDFHGSCDVDPDRVTRPRYLCQLSI
ncbi:hypothetical protein Q3G72_031572 [Acer saccharum]|nr:hypothetical protein Q3G72_031572 [Acer saccharum]